MHTTIEQVFNRLPKEAPEQDVAAAVLDLLAARCVPAHVSMNALIGLYRFLALNNDQHTAAAAFATSCLSDELAARCNQLGWADVSQHC